MVYTVHTHRTGRANVKTTVGIYEYMLTCVAFGVNHTVDIHVFFSRCDVLDDVEMTLTRSIGIPLHGELDNETDNGIQTFKQSKYSK